MLTFKYQSDLDRWRSGKGPRKTRDQITLANALSASVSGRSITVTSWYAGRKDKDVSWHIDGTCFDIRFRDLTDSDVKILVDHFTKAGIPIIDLSEGANRHGHVGDVMTKATEGR